MHKFWHTYERVVLISLAFILFFTTIYLFNVSQKTLKENLSLKTEALNLKNGLEDLNKKYVDTVSLLETKEKDRQFVVEGLNQIGVDYTNLMQKYNVTQTEVLTLKRTVEIDDELLKKYSKFYFLNENYNPKDLVSIAPNFTREKDIKLIAIVKFRLEQMLYAASSTETKIVVHSGYRSFNEQKGLKTSYSQTFGVSKANSFAADQGYSEHQLGTTVDVSDGKKILETSFEKTKAFEWLKNNAHLYGFTLSYPKNNKFYIYEPWHYRFVGIELATYLFNNRQNFYDLDQKFIDGYKLKMFE